MACRTARPKRELFRVVRTPDGSVVLDPTGRLAGRGAYLCVDDAGHPDGRTEKALGRALETSLPAGLLAELERASDTMTEQGGARGQE